MFGFIWLVMRAIGRKELSGLTSFDLILLITMGDLIQQGVTQQDTSVTAAMLAVATMALLVVGTSYVSFRWSRVSRVTEGLSVVIVRDGRIQRELLRIERLTEDEVKEAAREQGIADLRDVTVGILESDGRFSFIKRSEVDRQQQTTDEEPRAT
ncbi:MAG: DUF421 domain-containing protein [Actinobacteria bacterium]|nr:DUF421 domain-containing protein [Actinomycetota bacterium]